MRLLSIGLSPPTDGREVTAWIPASRAGMTNGREVYANLQHLRFPRNLYAFVIPGLDPEIHAVTAKPPPRVKNEFTRRRSGAMQRPFPMPAARMPGGVLR